MLARPRSIPSILSRSVLAAVLMGAALTAFADQPTKSAPPRSNDPASSPPRVRGVPGHADGMPGGEGGEGAHGEADWPGSGLGLGHSATAYDAILPEVDFNEVPFNDVIAFLQDSAKGYRAVVVNHGDKQQWPKVSMRLKNVSVGQLLEVICTAYPGISIESVDGPTGSIDVIRYVNVPMGPGGGFMAGMAGGMPGGMGDGPNSRFVSGEADSQPVVRVYRLSGTVMQMLAERLVDPTDKSQKEALANVLSLVKAMMEAVGGKEPAKLQLHEETQALIFSGSPVQQQALEGVLAALDSDRALPLAKGDAAALEAQSQRLQKQLEESRAALEKSRQDAVLSRTELSAVQRQLDLQMQEQALRNREHIAMIEVLRAKITDLEGKLDKAAKP